MTPSSITGNICSYKMFKNRISVTRNQIKLIHLESLTQFQQYCRHITTTPTKCILFYFKIQVESSWIMNMSVCQIYKMDFFLSNPNHNLNLFYTMPTGDLMSILGFLISEKIDWTFGCHCYDCVNLMKLFVTQLSSRKTTRSVAHLLR